MSSGCLVRVVTSIVDSVVPPMLPTKAVGRHPARTGTAEALPAPAPKSAPANANAVATRIKRHCRIPAPCLAVPQAPARAIQSTPHSRLPTGGPDINEPELVPMKALVARRTQQRLGSRSPDQPHITAALGSVLDAP